MSVQRLEAVTDEEGNIRLAETVHLPALTKVYVIVPEQTMRYAEIVPKADTLSLDTMRFPSLRVQDAGLAKRLVKTIVEDTHAEL